MGERVAVRSSAVGEDSEEDSFAGQMDSFLYVTKDQLKDRIIDCMASAYSERAMIYRHQRGGSSAVAVVRCAVLVQRMVCSQTAGVLFTVDPTAPSEGGPFVVAAAYGLGEGVVAGLVECDSFYIERQSGAVIRSEAGFQQRRVVYDERSGSGTYLDELPPELGRAVCLRVDQLAQLHRLGVQLAEKMGGPQDIEWAFDDKGQLFVLQSRPITTLPGGRCSPDSGDELSTLYDNANIVESYPGIVLPLTFSVALASYEEIFRESAIAQGIPKKILRQEPALHNHLLGLIDGRMYYNLTAWYRRFECIPGASQRIPAWEKALGVEPSGREQRGGEPLSRFDRLRALFRRMQYFFTLDGRVASYLKSFKAEENRFSSLKLEQMGSHQLLQTVEGLLGRIRGPYLISLINDSFAQVSYHQLGALFVRWQIDTTGSLLNELLCGEQGMESVAPVRSLVSLAELIAKEPELLALIKNDGDEAEEVVWSELKRRTAGTIIGSALSEHICLYGDRVLHELKIETPSLAENPTFILAMLRNYLRSGRSIEAMEQHERTIRERAEERLISSLRRRPVKAMVIRFILRVVRRTLKNRENLRLARTRGMGMVKRIYRALGQKLARSAVITQPQDILYLTSDEVGGLVRGTSVTGDIKALIRLRKTEYDLYTSQPHPPPRMVMKGPVQIRCSVSRPAPKRAIASALRAADTPELQGIGCSPGIVQGVAKIVQNPEDELRIDGEILVAPMTDPGWVFLMVAAKALVSERGSVLSHTAIIGRELGIPTVVGIRNITQILKDGEYIEVDGQAGAVRFVKPEGS